MITYCDCKCHEKDSTVMHFVECCDTCLKCGKGIAIGIQEHVKLCTGDLLNKKKRWKAGRRNTQLLCGSESHLAQ